MNLDNIFSNFNNLLRYLIPGAIFLFFILNTDILYAKDYNEISINSEISTSYFFIFIGASIVIGYLLYSIYRTIFYPLIHLFLITLILRPHHKYVYSKKTKFKFFYYPVVQDIKRFKFKAVAENKTVSDELLGWASFIHFNYLVILILFLCNCFVINETEDQLITIGLFKFIFCWLTLLLYFILNVWHHVRYTLRELELTIDIDIVSATR